MIRRIASELLEGVAVGLGRAAVRLRGKAPSSGERLREQQREAERKAREAAARSDADEIPQRERGEP